MKKYAVNSSRNFLLPDTVFLKYLNFDVQWNIFNSELAIIRTTVAFVLEVKQTLHFIINFLDSNIAGWIAASRKTL
jgi:hypothetical protein